MTALLLAQVAARWGQALVLLLVSAAATTAAVSVPVFGVAVERAVIATEVAAADRSELMVRLGPRRWEWSPVPHPDPAITLLGQLDGFDRVVTTEVPVGGVSAGASSGRPPGETPGIRRLVAREGICTRVVFGEGRCPVGNREAALPAALAATTGLSAGDQVSLTPVGATLPDAAPSGPPVTLSLVGVFTPPGPDAPEGTGDGAGDGSGEGPGEGPGEGSGEGSGGGALYTTHHTLQSMEHGTEMRTVAAVMPPGLLDPGRIPGLRADLERVAREAALVGGQDPVALETGIPRLLDRIAAGADRARALLPVVVLPLLGVCWLVVHLAVRHGPAGRRPELGLVAVRGASPRIRVAVLAGGSLLPVALAAPLGFLAAHLLALAGVGTGAGWVPVAPDQWGAAAVAVAGSALAVLAALRRELAAPVASLLRRVPGRDGHRAVAATEVLAVVLAVVAVAQLRWSGDIAGGAVSETMDQATGEAAGPTLGQAVGQPLGQVATTVAPALVVLAVAVLLARVVRPVLGVAARRSLRRGRLAPAVAARHLARRPGTARLVVVLALGSGLLGFAAVEAGVAARHRAVGPERALGAARVLDLEAVEPARLLQAVRAADPEGRYAMAVVAAPPLAPRHPPGLAVDAGRLARVASWLDGYGELSAGQVAARLRPPAAAPVWVVDGDLVIEVSLLAADQGNPGRAGEPGEATVSFALAPPTGARPTVVRFGPLTPGRAVYREPVTGCAGPCRLVDVAVSADGAPRRTVVTWHGIRQGGAALLPAGWLRDASRWRPLGAGGDSGDPGGTTVTANRAGVTIGVAQPRIGARYRVRPPDVPYPLPVVSTVDLPADRLGNVDGEPVAVTPAARLAGLPGLGAGGVLMDLEYAVRSATRPAIAAGPQVWLAAGAPAELVDRLRGEGLVVTGDRTVSGLRERLESSGTAVALRFHLLAGGLAAAVGLGALGLVAAADRRTWGASLRALRAQGLARRTVTAAALWSYGAVAVIGAVTGGLAALAAWLAAGDRLAAGAVGVVGAVGAWPRWAPVLALWSAGVAVLAAAAVAAAWWQRAEVRRTVRGAGG